MDDRTQLADPPPPEKAVPANEMASPEKSAVRRGPSHIVNAKRYIFHAFTSFPRSLQNEALACLTALEAGPSTIAMLQRAIFAKTCGPRRAPSRRQEIDAGQAFEQLATLGAIRCTKRRGDGAWQEVALTEIGTRILADPDDWFDAGHLRRRARRRP